MHAPWLMNTDNATTIDDCGAQLLTAADERELLVALNECKRKLTEALDRIKGPDGVAGADDSNAYADRIAAYSLGDGPAEAALGVVFHRYTAIRDRLALANLRLVAHVARPFRDRRIAYADLIQEGFCGLLEAIDRFDLSHGTKLATYATWWIRQSIQRAIAAGAYPVRLTPRHLRQLAQNPDQSDRTGANGSTPSPSDAGQPLSASSEQLQRIRTAARPTISLDAPLHGPASLSLIDTMSNPAEVPVLEDGSDEAVGLLLQSLGPREQQIMALRYGLGGGERLSLSQVGAILEISKERVRQIQDRALEKLRAVANEQHLTDLSLPDA